MFCHNINLYSEYWKEYSQLHAFQTSKYWLWITQLHFSFRQCSIHYAKWKIDFIYHIQYTIHLDNLPSVSLDGRYSKKAKLLYALGRNLLFYASYRVIKFLIYLNKLDRLSLPFRAIPHPQTRTPGSKIVDNTQYA